jgi:hypothetical protein
VELEIMTRWGNKRGGRGDLVDVLTSVGDAGSGLESAGGSGSAMEAGSNGRDIERRQRGLDGNDHETVD